VRPHRDALRDELQEGGHVSLLVAHPTGVAVNHPVEAIDGEGFRADVAWVASVLLSELAEVVDLDDVRGKARRRHAQRLGLPQRRHCMRS